MSDIKAEILSVRFNTEARSELLSTVESKILNNEKTKIFTPNPQMLLKARKDPDLLSVLNSAQISIPDGIGISLASRLNASHRLSRIAGIDFAQDLLRIAEKHGYSVFLLGGKKGVAEAAKEKLTKQMPSLKICGVADGYFEKSGIENEKVLHAINKAAPDILFVCLGCPLQEQWISFNLPFLRSVKVAMGLGGSLDVWSGRLKRAPKLMQKTGTEWLYRAIREPHRLSVLFDIPLFLWLVCKEARNLSDKKAPIT